MSYNIRRFVVNVTSKLLVNVVSAKKVLIIFVVALGKSSTENVYTKCQTTTHFSVLNSCSFRKHYLLNDAGLHNCSWYQNTILYIQSFELRITFLDKSIQFKRYIT